MRAKDKPIALITGGWRGIGLAIAHALAKAGNDIAITGLGATGGEVSQTLTLLRGEGGKVAYYESDLADLSNHQTTIAAMLADFGRIDCLVNNAGIGSPQRGDFLELTPQNFDKTLAVNLRGSLFFTQAVVKTMLNTKEQPFPRTIITITSVSAEMSSPERLDYCISKAGLAALSQGLALRLAEVGISVFEVRPGIIQTAMTAAVTDKYETLIDQGLVPMKRWGQPKDIGSICASLASGDWQFATGSVIHADGGLSIARL